MLLFDPNISSKILGLIHSEFPGSVHVVPAGLQDMSDSVIFSFAREHRLTIVTFDSDFADLSIIRGYPPKVIWLRTGNQTTKNIAEILKAEVSAINLFLRSEEAGVLEIWPQY